MNIELKMRWEHFIHGVTGKKTSSMISIESRFPDVGKFTRLGDLRWSLTHWTLWEGPSGWFMLFPYGSNCWHVSRKQICISCVLFSFVWRKIKKEILVSNSS